MINKGKKCFYKTSRDDWTKCKVYDKCIIDPYLSSYVKNLLVYLKPLYIYSKKDKTNYFITI